MCIYRQLLVRHYKVYYPVRVHLIQHMVGAMHRLGFTASVSVAYEIFSIYLIIYTDLLLSVWETVMQN